MKVIRLTDHVYMLKRKVSFIELVKVLGSHCLCYVNQDRYNHVVSMYVSSSFLS